MCTQDINLKMITENSAEADQTLLDYNMFLYTVYAVYS
jgi:hypothetical protein